MIDNEQNPFPRLKLAARQVFNEHRLQAGDAPREKNNDSLAQFLHI